MRHLVGVVATLLLAATAPAQTATVTVNAAIYIGPEISATPLRVAAVGTILNVLEQREDWIQVEFNDPQWGRRVGWVQRSLVKVSAEELQPMDLSVRNPPPATSPAPPPAVPSPAPSRWTGQKFNVAIIDRKSDNGFYTYVVPGHSTLSSNTNVNCVVNPTNVNCIGAANATGWSTPALQGSYQVEGATLSLQLPDGRVAVVNCKSKVNWTEWNMNMYRSCRVPPYDNIQAEFDGDKAKLKWPVSIDGQKLQSETYTVLAVFPARRRP